MDAIEERRTKFAALLTELVDVILDQSDRGWAVDVEEQVDRLAALAADPTTPLPDSLDI